MDKALEIKRRAQRSIQNGDLDGALAEYEKLVALPDCDPYNFVLLADLLYKRGDHEGALERYLSAASAYQKTGLFKNAIAVCKKMMRLALSPALVLERLAELHTLDGLGTEAALYYQQLAEHLLRERRNEDAAAALRKAYEATPDALDLLERIGELLKLADDDAGAALALAEAAYHHHRLGRGDVSASLRERAETLKPGVNREFEVKHLLGGDHAAPAEPPKADPDDDEQATPGPPLLPTLRGPAAEEADDEIERFGALGGEKGSAFRPSAQGRDESVKVNLLSAAEIEAMLQKAQEKLRAGESAEASRLLTDAARAYEAVGRFDNAGTIYRSIAKSQSTGTEVLELWLANCERRDDRREAATVACELGDRAIQQGQVDEAHRWFERARSLDENNLLAHRRLQRLSELRDGVGPPELVSAEGATEGPAKENLAPAHTPIAPTPVFRAPVAPPAQPEPVRMEAPAPAPEPPFVPAEPVAAVPIATPAPEPALPPAAQAPVPEGAADRVELAVGRSEAVTFDLGALLSEFQRGIEAQLSGDAQGHYDLAMAYREMGLLDHAVESFRMALGHNTLSHRAAEMLGRCLLDQGRFDEAAHELAAALERPGLDAESTLGLRYLLGLAFEAGGRPSDALAEFERVFAEHPNYHDVAPKLRDLRKALGTP